MTLNQAAQFRAMPSIRQPCLAIKTHSVAIPLAAMLVATALHAAPPAPRSAWLAEGNATDQFGSVDGTPSGTLAYAPGVFGQAFSFDGSSRVDLARNAFRPLAGTDTTIVAWIKTNVGFDSAAVMFQDQWLIYFDSAQPGQVAGVWDNWPNRLLSGVDVRDGQWHHIASVYDSGTASLYVDGVLRASGARNRYGGCDACGVNALGAGYFASYVGLLDDVGIYGQALDVSEIQAVMSEGLAAAVPEPATYGLLLAGLLVVGAAAAKRSRRNEGATA